MSIQEEGGSLFFFFPSSFDDESRIWNRKAPRSTGSQLTTHPPALCTNRRQNHLWSYGVYNSPKGSPDLIVSNRRLRSNLVHFPHTAGSQMTTFLVCLVSLTVCRATRQSVFSFVSPGPLCDRDPVRSS